MGIAETFGHFRYMYYDRLKLGTLLSQGLCLLRIIPDIRIFQFSAYFFKTFFFIIEVKGTPSGLPGALEGL
jgi:hypothetical protein